MTDTPPASIIICIHNALEDVRACVASARAMEYPGPLEIVLVDDGSDAPTADFVESVAGEDDRIRMVRRDVAGGYTVAANTGLSLSTGAILALLNSDTVVPPRWLVKISRLFARHPDLGVVGPLSNAASWQSVPERSNPGGGWAVNELPEGWSVERMDREVESAAEGLVFPRVPLVNGFCYCVHRRLLDAIGPLDEKGFPRGFGEEDDFCLRAANAGFGLMIALDTYVFHAKSKSYGSTKRNELSKKGQATLKRLHGERRLKRSTETMKINPAIAEMRHRVGESVAAEVAS